MLDNSLIMFGSGLSDGNRHEHHNLPTLLVAGRAGGRPHPGRHLQCPDRTPASNLFLTMLDKVGVRADSFGDSNSQLQDLTDL